MFARDICINKFAPVICTNLHFIARYLHSYPKSATRDSLVQVRVYVGMHVHQDPPRALVGHEAYTR